MFGLSLGRRNVTATPQTPPGPGMGAPAASTPGYQKAAPIQMSGPNSQASMAATKAILDALLGASPPPALAPQAPSAPAPMQPRPNEHLLPPQQGSNFRQDWRLWPGTPLGQPQRADWRLWNPTLPSQTASGYMGLAQGGMVPGPSYPQDQVPIMATGGEGVIPQQLTDAILSSNSADPIVQAIRDVLMKNSGGPGSSMWWGGLVDRARAAMGWDGGGGGNNRWSRTSPPPTVGFVRG